jgi:YesN/AraC family two-component response regulator
MKILIVDDEPLVRRSLKKAFGAHGDCQVEEATDGFDGLAKWNEFMPDLVILDVLMPKMSGPELLQKVKNVKNKTKVVLISAYSGEYNLEMAQKLGADLFLVKPFEDIFETVRICLGLIKDECFKK